jgi:DNA topoisomerase-1
MIDAGSAGHEACEATSAVLDAEADAVEVGLRYVSDSMPGVRRRRAGRGFMYIGPSGRRLTDRARLAWFKRLAIPPAWTDVWISPLQNGHLQATGRDARGRKQYRYHPRWRTVRDAAKFDRILDFGRAISRIRRRTDRDLRRPGLPREKVVALVVRLLEATLMRVGSEEYRRENRSYGLSTLRDRHVDVRGTRIRMAFRGKSGREHEIEVSDARLARAVRRCQELPGQVLFQYVGDDGRRRSVESGDVNDYLRQVAGGDFTAKDFRTWAGTMAAALALEEVGTADSDAEAKRNVASAIERVAAQLGNTPAICRTCYVHPEIVTSYLDGTLAAALTDRVTPRPGRSLRALTPEESSVLGLLRARLARERRRSAAAT